MYNTSVAHKTSEILKVLNGSMRCLKHLRQGWFFGTGYLAPFQYPIRRLNLRSCATSNPEIRSLGYRTLSKNDRLVGSSAAEIPIKFQFDRTIIHTNPATLRLYGYLRLFKYWNRAPVPFKEPRSIPLKAGCCLANATTKISPRGRGPSAGLFQLANQPVYS